MFVCLFAFFLSLEIIRLTGSGQHSSTSESWEVFTVSRVLLQLSVDHGTLLLPRLQALFSSHRLSRAFTVRVCVFSRAVSFPVEVCVAATTAKVLHHHKDLSSHPSKSHFLPPPPAPTLTPGNGSSVLHFYNFLISMLYKWNHTVCNILGLVIFSTQHNSLAIHPSSCVYQSFVPSSC